MLSACIECGARFPRKADEQWKRLCLPCWRKTKGTATPALDPTRIRQLLQLAHPDKHGNSPLATEVTQWLLAIKGARK